MVGDTISYYPIMEKIGQGGTGGVYRAEDTNQASRIRLLVPHPASFGLRRAVTKQRE